MENFVIRSGYWGCGLDGDYGTEAAYGYFWGHNYRIIDITNSIIKGAEELIQSGNSSDELIKNLSEAKVFRAHSYFTLYRLFNNIYIKTEPTNPETAFDRPSEISSKEDIFNLIKQTYSTLVITCLTQLMNLGAGIKGL